jgi:Xaa-Pro aminopeptidase
MTTTMHLAHLRTLLAQHNADAFFLPRTDPWQNEYVAPQYERLQRLTGFNGSAGGIFIGRWPLYFASPATG